MRELSPNSVDGLRMLGNIENYSGNPREAIDILEECMRLDPHGPSLGFHVLGQAWFVLGEWAKAEEQFRHRIAREPDTDSSYVFLAGTLGHLGRMEEAQAQWKQVFNVKPDYSLAERTRLWPYQKPDVIDYLYAGLEKAGIDPGPR
jgi:tetratricopeptide (TPR) repeat protein